MPAEIGQPRGNTAMKTGFVRSMLAPALLLASLSGCEGLLHDGDEEQRQQFAVASARWAAADIDSYTFTLGLACECGSANDLRDIVVTVRNGAVVSREYEDDPGTAAPESIFGPYDTVEELFQVVASSISRDADLLNVGYHPTYGIPVLLQVDPSTTVADDYLIFQVLDFAPAAAP